MTIAKIISALRFPGTLFSSIVVLKICCRLLTLGLLASSGIRTIAWAVPPSVKPTPAPIVVIGATPAGIMAAISAARLGSQVTIVELTDHVGGIMSNGLTKADIINTKAIGGLFVEYTQTVLRYYENKYGKDSKQVQVCKGGFEPEPHVVELAYRQMLKEQPSIHILFRHRLKQALKEGNTLVGIVVENLVASNQELTIRGKTFIDATYEGDLAALAGARYWVGRESRQTYGERHAGVIYSRFGQDEYLTGSTGEGDKAIQGYCFRMSMSNIPENRVPVEKPSVYNRDDYKYLLEDIKGGLVIAFNKRSSEGLSTPVQLMPKPNNKVEINSNHPSPRYGAPKESLDLTEENWAYPEATYEERKKIIDRFKNYHIGLLWFLQNDPELPEDFRRAALEWGFSKDEYVTNSHFPRQLYIREARRIQGEYVLTERDGDVDSSLGRTRLQSTSIAIAEFPFDSHGCHKYNPAFPGVREGYFYIDHEPIQIPYGILVPQNVEGLLVPICASTSHVGFQTIRVEPTLMVLGQAAGVAAHLAGKQNLLVRHVPIEVLQQELIRQKSIITYYDNLSSADPDYAALQFLGARGLNKGYTVDPSKILSHQDMQETLGRIASQSNRKWILPTLSTDRPFRIDDLQNWLKQNKLKWKTTTPVNGSQQVTIRVVAQAIYGSWKTN